MKKFFLVLFMFFIFPVICFAEDIYIGENNLGIAYLRTESINTTCTFTRSVNAIPFDFNYDLYIIPSIYYLFTLKELQLDNRITHIRTSYHAVVYCDRINGEVLSDNPNIEIVSINLYDKNNN